MENIKREKRKLFLMATERIQNLHQNKISVRVGIVNQKPTNNEHQHQHTHQHALTLQNQIQPGQLAHPATLHTH